MPSVEERVARMEGQLSELSTALRSDIGRLDDRMSRLDDQMSRQFHWIVGIQITSLLAMLGTMLSLARL